MQKQSQIYINKSESLQASLLKDKLDNSLRTVGDMALKRRAKKIIEGLDLKKRERILEVGCGNGYYLSLLNRLDLNLNLTGIDIDEKALKDAVKFIGNGSVKLIRADGSKIPFARESFDKIVMGEVIEHVANEETVLREVCRVLKRGGILVLTTCNLDYPFLWDPVNWILHHFFKMHIKRGFWAGIWNQHTRLYKKEQVEKLIKNAGFQIEQSEALTSWCLPFNHYIVNFIAKLFYARMLPESIHKSMNKFQNNKQPLLINLGFKLINFFDRLNDLFPQKTGVSIFIKARKGV